MALKPNVWNQLKSITKGELITALKRDGWYQELQAGVPNSFSSSPTQTGLTAASLSISITPKTPWGVDC